MIGASASFALMALFVKRVSKEIPEGEVVLFRSVVALAAATLMALRGGTLGKLRGVAHGMLVTRGLIGCASMFAYFYAIHHMKLGDAVLLTYMSPLFVSAMAPFVLGERVVGGIWIALALGMAGVAVVGAAQQQNAAGTTEMLGVAAGLGSAVLAAGAYVSVRKLAATDGSATIVFWFSAIAIVIGAASCGFAWVTPHGTQIRDLLLIGVFAATAQLLMTQSYAVSEASRVSIYGYATPVLSYLLGLAVLRETPGLSGIAGTALVLAAGLVAARVQAPSPRPT